MKKAIKELVDLAFDLKDGGNGVSLSFTNNGVDFWLCVDRKFSYDNPDVFKTMWNAEDVLLLIKEVKEIMLKRAERYQEKCEALNV